MKRTTWGDRPRSERLQWATLVISCTALFVALGVPSWAAGLIGPGQIQNDAIRSRHIKDNAVKSKDIADGKVSATDLAADSVGSEEIQSNAVDSDEIAASAVNSEEIATNAVNSDEIAANAVGSPELEPSSVSTSEVTNFSLLGDDVGRDSGTIGNYDAPAIAANSCLFQSINLGVGAKDFREDAIVATPDHNWPGGISVTPVGSAIIGNIQLTLCNHTAGAINPPAQPLNWIAFNVG